MRFREATYPCGSGPHLVFRRVVALREVPADLAVMQQVVVDQIPAPTLVVAAQQSHVTLALHRRALCGDAYDCHGAQGAFPPDLPGVPPFHEADLASRAIRALGDGVAVQREAVLFHVDVARAVVGAQRVLEGFELQRVGRTSQMLQIWLPAGRLTPPHNCAGYKVKVCLSLIQKTVLYLKINNNCKTITAFTHFSL